jgi:uncharacterized protein (TIGR02145 family)
MNSAIFFSKNRFLKICIFSLCIISTLLINCSGDDKTKDPIADAYIEITAVTDGDSFSSGSSFSFQINTDNNDVTLAAVLFNEDEIGTFKVFPSDVHIDLTNTSPGSYILKVIAYVDDLKVKTIEINIVVTEATSTKPEFGKLTDVDGNEYKSVKIGTQVWMAENLRTLHYRNGDAIENTTDNGSWADLTAGSVCYYENKSSNAIPYGCLYNFYAVNDSRSICPDGWHIPSRDEMDVLIDYLGGWKIAGGKLKEEGNEHWNSPLITIDNAGTNESGFSAVAAGTRNVSGQFQSFGYKTDFWLSNSTTSLSGKLMAYNRYLGKSNNEISEEGVHYATLGFSVRCIKD